MSVYQITTLTKMERASKILRNIKFHSPPIKWSIIFLTAVPRGVVYLIAARKTGVRLIAYSPLAKGLLTGKYTAETPPPVRAGGDIPPS